MRHLPLWPNLENGGVGYEVEAADGTIGRTAIVTRESSQLVAVAPAVLAARAIVEQRFPYDGLVAADRQTDSEDLWGFLHSHGNRPEELDRC